MNDQTPALPPAASNPAPPALYVNRLNDLRGVRRELARVYTEARRGKLDPSTASKLANVLAILGRLIEGSDIEERLTALEQTAATSAPNVRRFA